MHLVMGVFLLFVVIICYELGFELYVKLRTQPCPWWVSPTAAILGLTMCLSTIAAFLFITHGLGLM